MTSDRTLDPPDLPNHKPADIADAHIRAPGGPRDRGPGTSRRPARPRKLAQPATRKPTETPPPPGQGRPEKTPGLCPHPSLSNRRSPRKASLVPTRALPLRRQRAAIALTAVTLTLTGCANTGLRPNNGAIPVASTPASPSMSAPMTPADRLRHLADTLTPMPGDSKDPAVYRYTYLRVQHWDRATNVVARTDDTWWRANDGTGQSNTRRLPERPDLTRMPTPTEQRKLAAAPVTIDQYPEPGRLSGTLTEPVPADQATLTAKLFEHQPAETGPQALLWAYCDLARHHYLNQAVRASTLRILATINRLTYTGTAQDLAGRTGMAFHLDSPGNHDSILLDPATGRLLVCSQNNATTPPALFSYALLLDSDRVAHIGDTPNPTRCPAPDRTGICPTTHTDQRWPTHTPRPWT